jgi:hypothetical protein
VPDGVDPAVKQVQTTDLAAIRNRVAVKTRREQLPDRDHAMLTSGHFGDQNLGCAEFVGTVAMNFVHPVYVGASTRTKGAPPPFRHTSLRLSPQSERRPRRSQVADEAAGAPTEPTATFGLREASATPPKISASPPIDAAVIGSSSSRAP